ncbi:hypothetical protein [Steroidobacter sp.]
MSLSRYSVNVAMSPLRISSGGILPTFNSLSWKSDSVNFAPTRA